MMHLIRDDDLARFASVMYQLHFAQLIMLAGIEKWRADREEKRRG